jgi:hypothetical protein
MKKLKIYLLFILLSLLFCNQISAQNDNSSSKIDRKKWEKVAEDYDYSNEYVQPQEKHKPKEKENKKLPKLDEKPFEFSQEFVNILKYSLFAVVILLLVYIGYILIRNGNFWNNYKIDKPKVYTIENIEENLEEADIVSFLDEALLKNDFRLAIRLMYLNILKEMSIRNLIQWKKDKTNGDYLYELRKTALYNDFRKCTLAYEFIWFNNLEAFDLDKFNSVKPDFDSLLSLVNNSTKKTAK